ncbi:hypothetical protein [Lysobacter gummosus]|uniref:hypothetical protein n=1 Tax=Lysobacter gummosus TaxID=262324 RepID=UPI00363D045E
MRSPPAHLGRWAWSNVQPNCRSSGCRRCPFLYGSRAGTAEPHPGRTSTRCCQESDSSPARADHARRSGRFLCPPLHAAGCQNRN